MEKLLKQLKEHSDMPQNIALSDTVEGKQTLIITLEDAERICKEAYEKGVKEAINLLDEIRLKQPTMPLSTVIIYRKRLKKLLEK